MITSKMSFPNTGKTPTIQK